MIYHEWYYLAWHEAFLLAIIYYSSTSNVLLYYTWSFNTSLPSEQNFCFDHPPNKCTFVLSKGLTTAISALRCHAMNSDVQKQGLSLLLYILSDDPQSKFNINDARRTALSLGLITVLEAAQINFKEDKDIRDPCSCLLKIMADIVQG